MYQEVQQREEIVARKEAMLAEKRELEMKKLRSSQVLNKVKHLSLCAVVENFKSCCHCIINDIYNWICFELTINHAVIYRSVSYSDLFT